MEPSEGPGRTALVSGSPQTAPAASASAAGLIAWPWVLCLIGLDYFSTLGYQPSLAFEAAGLLAPLAANLHFVLFGEGNVPWLVRELIRKAEIDPTRRPRVFIG